MMTPDEALAILAVNLEALPEYNPVQHRLQVGNLLARLDPQRGDLGRALAQEVLAKGMVASCSHVPPPRFDEHQALITVCANRIIEIGRHVVIMEVRDGEG
jgi:hypothetical protein